MPYYMRSIRSVRKTPNASGRKEGRKENHIFDYFGSPLADTLVSTAGVFIDRLRKTFAGTKSALVFG